MGGVAYVHNIELGDKIALTKTFVSSTRRI